MDLNRNNNGRLKNEHMRNIKFIPATRASILVTTGRIKRLQKLALDQKLQIRYIIFDFS